LDLSIYLLFQDKVYDIEIGEDKITVALGRGHELNIMSWNALNQTKNNVKVKYTSFTYSHT
jgi:hypothetical protein